jgi:hypothetical protein
MNTMRRAAVKRLQLIRIVFTGVLAAGWIIPFTPATAQNPYPTRAPIAQYLMASEGQEIALAKSAAPDSVSARAEVLTLAKTGYETVVKGSNGFVCVVVRAWDNDFASKEFWNPKARSPICFNAAAAGSVLRAYLLRTKWVLAGVDKAGMEQRDRAALASGAIKPPAVGAMSYMMSKHGYLNDDAHGPWHPHVMFFEPRTQAAQWGANLSGSPVMADADADDATSIFFVVVRAWSDGTPDQVRQ